MRFPHVIGRHCSGIGVCATECAESMWDRRLVYLNTPQPRLAGNPPRSATARVYCDRDTRFDVVDALAVALLRPCPLRTAGRVSSIAQRARQHAAFQREMRDWRRWRCTTLARHAVAEENPRA